VSSAPGVRLIVFFDNDLAVFQRLRVLVFASAPASDCDFSPAFDFSTGRDSRRCSAFWTLASFSVPLAEMPTRGIC